MAKCKDCCRLGVLDEYTDELREATQRVRDTGWHQSSQGNATRAKVTCYAGIREFNGVSQWKPEFVCKIISLEFECPSFTKYTPGRSPKDIEAVDIQTQLIAIQQGMLNLQEKLLNWKQGQSDRDQKWDQQLQALQEIRHQETVRVSKSEARGTNWQAASGVAALVISLLALIVSLFRR